MTLPVRNKIGAFPRYLWLDECKIINRLITAILERGFYISVSDGEEWVLQRCRNRREIQEEVAATDETVFLVRDNDGMKVGAFYMIHGNRAHVVGDHTDNQICEEIFAEIEPTIEKMET